MDIISKNRALTITVIIFAILNIVSIVMFWTINKKEPNPAPIKPEQISKEKNENNNSEAKDRIIEELNLNPDQIQKLNLLFDKFTNDSKNIKNEIRENHKKINESIAERQDTNGIQEKFNKLGAAKAKLDRLSYDFFNDLYNLCDNKQKDNFKELFKDINKLISSRENTPGKKDDDRNKVREDRKKDERREFREDRKDDEKRERRERKKERRENERNDRRDGPIEENR